LQANEETFDEHILHLLKSRGTLPLFKFEEKAMSSPQEALKVLTKLFNAFAYKHVWVMLQN